MNNKINTKIILSIAVLSLIFLAGCANGTNKEELKPCTLEYMPVCGIDGTTYSNECMAGNIEVAYQGECGLENAFLEPKLCTREYVPVCGADGVTYPNKCMAGNMIIISEGTCEVETHVCTAEEKQNEICTLEYIPVCGSDGITYGNACAACASGKINSWTEGECNN